jgi:DNA-binding NarL/FixJ family response regulator
MKILLVDDHQLFREGIALLLDRLAEGLQIVQASNCEEAFASCAEHSDISLILLDLYLGSGSGLDGLQVFRARYPSLPVVVMSSVEDERTVRQAIDLGAMGFIPKSSSSEVMLNALRLVLGKGIYLPPAVLFGTPPLAASIFARPGAGVPAITPSAVSPRDLGLTPRQVEVLYLILQGMPIKLISRELKLGEGTVKGHVSSVLRALNVTTRTQAVVAAHRLGLQFGATGSRFNDPSPAVDASSTRRGKAAAV